MSERLTLVFWTKLIVLLCVCMELMLFEGNGCMCHSVEREAGVGTQILKFDSHHDEGTYHITYLH